MVCYRFFNQWSYGMRLYKIWDWTCWILGSLFMAVMVFAMAGTGGAHTALLRGDGRAFAVGRNNDGQCLTPVLEAGVEFAHISAGGCSFSATGVPLLSGGTMPGSASFRCWRPASTS